MCVLWHGKVDSGPELKILVSGPEYLGSLLEICNVELRNGWMPQTLQSD